MTDFEIVQLSNEFIRINEILRLQEERVVQQELQQNVADHIVDRIVGRVFPYRRRSPSPVYSSSENEEESNSLEDEDEVVVTTATVSESEDDEEYIEEELEVRRVEEDEQESIADTDLSNLSTSEDDTLMFATPMPLPNTAVGQGMDIIPMPLHNASSDMAISSSDASMHSANTSSVLEKSGATESSEILDNSDTSILPWNGFETITEHNNDDQHSLVIANFEAAENIIDRSFAESYYASNVGLSSRDRNSIVLPIYHDTSLLLEVNLHNMPRGKPITVVSCISPGIGAQVNYEYMLCHICHFHSGIPRNKLEARHPFIKTIGAMYRHLLAWHCKKVPKGQKRHLSLRAVKYLASIKDKFFVDCYTPMLQVRSHRKAISTSCLVTTWKSDQPEFTQNRLYMYVFDEEICKGHSKVFPLSGLIHVMDLAVSIYCPCGAVTTSKLARHPSHQLSNSGIDLNIQPMKIDCIQTRLTIQRQHRTLRCSYLFPMKHPDPIPIFVNKARRPATRSLTVHARSLDHLILQQQQLKQQQLQLQQSQNDQDLLQPEGHTHVQPQLLMGQPLQASQVELSRPRMPRPSPQVEQVRPRRHRPSLLRVPVLRFQQQPMPVLPVRGISIVEQRGQPEGQAAAPPSRMPGVTAAGIHTTLSSRGSGAWQRNKGGGRSPREGYAPEVPPIPKQPTTEADEQTHF